MSGAEHVPGPQDRCIQAALLDDLFALLPHGDVGLHGRRGMGNADEYEMAGVCFHCCCNRDAQGSQIDGAKLLRLGRTGMGHADQMDKCAALENVRVVPPDTALPKTG